MPSININNLRFDHKGTYSGSTTYSARDVVLYNTNAYVAKTTTLGNVPTNTTFWSPIAEGSTLGQISGLGTNDFIYWNGSGFSKVSPSTPNKALGVSGGAFSLIDTGTYIATHYLTQGSRIVAGNAGGVGPGPGDFVNFGSFTPVDCANNHLIVNVNCPTRQDNQDSSGRGMRFSGPSTYDFVSRGQQRFDPSQNHMAGDGQRFMISAGTMTQGTYTVTRRSYTGGSQPDYVNPNGSDNGRVNAGTTSTVIIMEVSA